jgi:two-component system nitrogen regulation response regulator GlnG
VTAASSAGASAAWPPDYPDPSADDEEFETFLIRQLEPVFRSIVDRRRYDAKASPLDEVERVLVRRALNETNGNQVRAARMLGMSRATLRKRIERFDIVIERLVR